MMETVLSLSACPGPVTSCSASQNPWKQIWLWPGFTKKTQDVKWLSSCSYSPSRAHGTPGPTVCFHQLSDRTRPRMAWLAEPLALAGVLSLPQWSRLGLGTGFFDVMPKVQMTKEKDILKSLKLKFFQGSWLAQLEEYMTLDLGVMNSSTMYGVESTKRKTTKQTKNKLYHLIFLYHRWSFASVLRMDTAKWTSVIIILDAVELLKPLPVLSPGCG